VSDRGRTTRAEEQLLAIHGARPEHSEIFEGAVEEGQRRLDQSLLELVSTSFIAGFTIVFGIVALGIVEAMSQPLLGDASSVAGALAFGIGIVFLVVGRAELFTENFSDPVAAVVTRRQARHPLRLARLWVITFALNFLGGGLMVLVFSVDGVLPAATDTALADVAAGIAGRGDLAAFLNAVAGGALVALMSFLLQAVNSVGGRIVVAYLVGFLLALGPFDHVIVTGLQVLFGMLVDTGIGLSTLLAVIGLATAGNLAGGLGLVTLSHIAQAEGARASGHETEGRT
jgi:formate/nitrite transporter FocA (FNT family)